MLDRNKLNRVKGILSARQGAEIPKYDGGAKFTKKNQANVTIYSNDGQSWFTDGALKNPFSGNIAEFQDVVTPTTSYTIPGSIPITPTTAVEKASDQITKQEEIRSDIEAQEQAILLPEVVVTAARPKSSPNAGIPITSDTLQLPSSIQVPKLIQEQIDLQGEKLKQDKEKKEKTEKRNELIGTASAITTAAFQGLGTAMGAHQTATDSTVTKGANVAYNQITDTVSSLGPTGKIVGTALKNAAIAGNIIQGLGGGTDQMTSTDKWMDSSFFSWNVGMLNGFGGKKSDAFAADQDILASVGSSYGGTTDDINKAAAKANKKYGLFSSSARRRANRQIADARVKQNLMGDISEEATDQRLAVQSMGEQAGIAYQILSSGGYDQKYTYAAKHGGSLEWTPIITNDWKPKIELNWDLPTFKDGGNIDITEELEWTPELQKGGTLVNDDVPEIEETNQKNVIPEGALHKNKHHMEHAEGLTKKGIPVIDEDGEQQAEIEHSEIIFTLEVTKKLEEYYDIFYSDETTNKEKEQAALDAGKLLVYQILENTEDRTGLIESCKKGGTLTLKKSTEDLIEEVLEWMPVITIIEETIEESKKEEPEKKSEKEMMKEAIKEVLIELLTK